MNLSSFDPKDFPTPAAAPQHHLASLPGEPRGFASDFDARNSTNSSVPPVTKIKFVPTPYVYRAPETIPPREWLYGSHYIRSYVTSTVAPGGSGKSALVIAETLAMATGTAFLGFKPVHQLRAWYFGGEDPREETERRIAAHVKHHNLDPTLVASNLFFDSGRDVPIKIAHIDGRNGFSIAIPTSDALIEAIQENKIDVLIIDPFVSSHSIPENDNTMIDAVVKEFGRIAGICNCSIELVHHTRKNSGGEVTGEDARGAKSMIDGIRAQRVINIMTPEECGLAQVPESKRRSYFRVGDEKMNMKPAGEVNWYHLASVLLGNSTHLYPGGDDVAAVEAFKFPDLFDGMTKDHLRTAQNIVSAGRYGAANTAKDWAGHAIAAAIGLKTDDKGSKKRMTAILKTWTNNGMFTEERVTDKNGRERPMLRVGKLADMPASGDDDF